MDGVDKMIAMEKAENPEPKKFSKDEMNIRLLQQAAKDSEEIIQLRLKYDSLLERLSAVDDVFAVFAEEVFNKYLEDKDITSYELSQLMYKIKDKLIGRMEHIVAAAEEGVNIEDWLFEYDG